MAVIHISILVSHREIVGSCSGVPNACDDFLTTYSKCNYVDWVSPRPPPAPGLEPPHCLPPCGYDRTVHVAQLQDISDAKDAGKLAMADIFAIYRDRLLACPCETCAVSRQACGDRPLVVGVAGKPDKVSPPPVLLSSPLFFSPLLSLLISPSAHALQPDLTAGPVVDRLAHRCVQANAAGTNCCFPAEGGVAVAEACTTDDGVACELPFTYNNRVYDSCTVDRGEVRPHGRVHIRSIRLGRHSIAACR